MNHCVNINSKEFRDLTKAANMNPVILAAKVSIWQEENGLDKFPKLSQLMSENAINYVMDAAQILSSPEADIVFKKAEKSRWSLDKILTELQIPKTQKQIILQSGKTNRRDIVVDLLVNHSYAVEINTAKNNVRTYGINNETNISDGESFTVNGVEYSYDPYSSKEEQYSEGNRYIDKEDYDAAKLKADGTETPTQHYSNLTVQGGTNYTENEIATPAITPTIKGHAQFATDNGIGWFRSDDKVNSTSLGLTPSQLANMPNDDIAKFSSTTNTRRILELQSDLFQKGRDKEELVGILVNEAKLENASEIEYDLAVRNGEIFESRGDSEEDNVYKYNDYFYWIEAELDPEDGSWYTSYYKRLDNIDRIEANPQQNQFLQLLNKDNNWVTFFIKSIIQDSAKKGYEKVLFPTGNTASKIEGHTTLEEFKKEKENRIKVIEFNALTRAEKDGIKVKNKEEADKVKKEYLTEKDDIEIAQLKQELEGIEGPEGFAALKPIYNFYENTVFNILKKQGLINDQITDEHGNTWNEVVLGENKKQSISLTSKNFNNFVNEAYEDSIFSFLTKESDHIEYFNNCK